MYLYLICTLDTFSQRVSYCIFQILGRCILSILPKILFKVSSPTLAGSTVLAPTLLMEDCSAAMDWNAVNWTMKATEMTTTFFMTRPEGDLGDTAALIRSKNEADILINRFLR